jgi:looped-hinge helix DNA binding domain, AbrB family
MLATVTDKGQVTVPKEIRDRLGITPGAKLDFEVLPDGTLRVQLLARGSENLFGLLHQPGMKARTVEEMDAGSIGGRAR